MGRREGQRSERRGQAREGQGEEGKSIYLYLKLILYIFLSFCSTTTFRRRREGTWKEKEISVMRVMGTCEERNGGMTLNNSCSSQGGQGGYGRRRGRGGILRCLSENERFRLLVQESLEENSMKQFKQNSADNSETSPVGKHYTMFRV